MDYMRIILHKNKERSLLLFHPWVFSGAIRQLPENIMDGDIAEVWSSDGKYLCTGHYHKGTIMVRAITFNQEELDPAFWCNKIEKALDLRKRIGLIDNKETNVYRLIHAEGDGIPGLVVDIYNDIAVMQFHSTGISNHRHEISDALLKMMDKKLNAVYNKSSESMQKQNHAVFPDDYIYKSGNFLPANHVTENGFRFHVDHISGQKTGFFIDQRENRKLLMDYCSGRKVLNTFCYTGGFSVYAAGAGASMVHSVDSSKKAIEETDRNIALNFKDAMHKSFAVDAFAYLKQNEMSYDVIVLDPPAFAKHISSVKNAMVGYRNINLEALKKIQKGGILFTFSCSQAVDKELFRKIVFQAAAQSKRNVKILHQLSQPADHPISIFHPEGEYLKGLVLYVE